MKEKILTWSFVALAVVFFVWYVRREKARAFRLPTLFGFDEIVYHASTSYDVPAAWVFAVIRTESKGNPRAVNQSDPSGAWGLMQILYTTAVGLGYKGQPEGLFDPDLNVHLGTKYLAQLRGQYGNDFSRVYSAYNSGNPTPQSQLAKSNLARAVANLEAVQAEVNA